MTVVHVACVRADVSYFLYCTRKRDVPFPRAIKEIGDVCTQEIVHVSEGLRVTAGGGGGPLRFN